MITLSAGYFRNAVEDPDALIERAHQDLADVDFDTIIGTGFSGSVIIPQLARALDKHWLLLRKPNDGTHGDARGEGVIGNRWIFVDDFVETGATKKRVLAAVGSIVAADSWRFDYIGAPEPPEPPVYVGTYLYRDAEDDGNGWRPA